MAASDGGRSESSKEPARGDATTGQAPLVKDGGSAAQVQDPAARTLGFVQRSLPMVAVTSSMAQAVKLSASSQATAVRFALGVPVGLLLSMVVTALVTPLYLLTAPMAFFLTVSTTMATAIFFARGFPLKDAFTNDEGLQRERAKAIYDERIALIDQDARRKQEHGMSGAEIQAALGPEYRRVREEYDAVLSALNATSRITRPALSPEASQERPSSSKT